MFRNKLASQNITPKSAFDALLKCNEDLYPNNIHFLFKIVCTLPVSTACPERPFSSLKRIKSYLRNTISEKRLNGLAMLSIHRDIGVNVDKVLNEMSQKPRRMNIIL
ncbi:52 kDa repressor of the inhibitor of the protein kinase-like [Acyrthosiphon pisum]|uniref:HAT C-terminal dimerisation domain-containing protein n=1 Tax=Acyrthosiphon pisum TaxID=7029 RepID=A0A8R2H701_ACYPI|nr:52 kDa repressor of the inhibitor of the protein kinase-like [Acyrthosiphon pisum]|eukprot:XP_016661809.1 PREDICTED: 52 kDa repressor of the inhibitor of the protein kinase-like [Acyrthosiphon pisum]